MDKKINVLELLKDCPKGMELDCTLCDNVTFDGIDDNNIVVERSSNGNKIYLSKWGTFFGHNDAKCVIFPKGKNTWEGFVPPCEFKDGDRIIDKNKFMYCIKKITAAGYILQDLKNTFISFEETELRFIKVIDASDNNCGDIDKDCPFDAAQLLLARDVIEWLAKKLPKKETTAE